MDARRGSSNSRRRPWIHALAPWLATIPLAAAACSADFDPLITPPPPVTLVFAGDVTFHKNIETALSTQGLTFDATLEPTRPFIESSDFAAFNLETAVADDRQPIEKRYTFNSSILGLKAAATAGFALANLANNHVLDYGPRGLEDTRRHLTELGLAECGITTNDEPQTPAIVELGGLRLGFLGYADDETPYAYAKEFLAFTVRPARAQPDLIARDIARLRPKVDHIIIEVHWGIETEPSTPRQHKLGHFMIDQGASLVVGHHPHVLQEEEWYGEGLILYSLGNFIFGLPTSDEQLKSRLYRVTLDSTGIRKAEYLSLEINPVTWAPTPIGSEYVEVKR